MPLDGGVVKNWLMMKHRQFSRMRLVAQINRGHPALMAPIFLHRQRLGERVHGIEDDQVCFVEEIHEGLLSLQTVHLIIRNQLNRRYCYLAVRNGTQRHHCRDTGELTAPDI